MMRIQAMSEIDRIQNFTRGLMTETKKEVEYKRCSTLCEAITTALDYERSHCGTNNQHRVQQPGLGPRDRTRDHGYNKSEQLGPTPMDINYISPQTRAECRAKGLCY
ncbi:hypothetical protein PINS_up013608 [Pythium insidiosum]|nr:hypothetical protein PINS_up013608 [Pythium insidiosum]